MTKIKCGWGTHPKIQKCESMKRRVGSGLTHLWSRGQGSCCSRSAHPSYRRFLDFKWGLFTHIALNMVRLTISQLDPPSNGSFDTKEDPQKELDVFRWKEGLRWCPFLWMGRSGTERGKNSTVIQVNRGAEDALLADELGYRVPGLGDIDSRESRAKYLYGGQDWGWFWQHQAPVSDRCDILWRDMDRSHSQKWSVMEKEQINHLQLQYIDWERCFFWGSCPLNPSYVGRLYPTRKT